MNDFHAIQSSFTRRFRNGWSAQLNYTLGLPQTNNSPARLEHDANGNVVYRSDQAAADELLNQGNLLRHVVKVNFVWDLPDLKSSGSVLRALSVVTTAGRIARLGASRDLHHGCLGRGGSGRTQAGTTSLLPERPYDVQA